jgi:hypothetical protein
LRYCIESTGACHLPALKPFGGIPSVVNPLAGASHRKTDVLDARTLAHHSTTGFWKASPRPAGPDTPRLFARTAAKWPAAPFSQPAGPLVPPCPDSFPRLPVFNLQFSLLRKNQPCRCL